MPADSHGHSEQVNVWIGRVANGLPAEELLELFEQAIGALWKRAHLTLGDVTLAAIVDRVLYGATEQFPFFELLKVGPAGIEFGEFRAQSQDFNETELLEGVRFVITEFIVVIGNLTAEILTPALHIELAKVMPGKQSPGSGKGKL